LRSHGLKITHHPVPDDIDSSREFGTTFDPFFAFTLVPDAAESDLPPGWPTEPVALHVLHQEVESCPDFHREFIEQACKSYPSFCVVESTAPGRSIDLKDILTGRHFHVLEQSASRMLRTGEAHVDDERYDAAGGIEAAVLTWLKAGNRKHKDWDNITLGTLRLDGSRLVMRSSRRGDRSGLRGRSGSGSDRRRRSSRRRPLTSSRNFSSGAGAATPLSP